MKSVFVSIFGFILLLIASIGILNLMLMAVFERTREMGVLQALGMKGRQVIRLVLLEAVTLGLLGAAVGLLLATPLVYYTATTGIDFAAIVLIGPAATRLQRIWRDPSSRAM